MELLLCIRIRAGWEFILFFLSFSLETIFAWILQLLRKHMGFHIELIFLLARLKEEELDCAQKDTQQYLSEAHPPQVLS